MDTSLRSMVYQRLHDPFFLPVNLEEGKTVSVEDVINAILKEDTPVHDGLHEQIFEGSKHSLKKFLENVEDVRNSFKRIVDETSQSRESGRSVGWALEAQLKKLIPQDLVGGRKNKESLLRNFRKAFLFGKQDLIPITVLTDGLNVKKVVWMKDPRLKQRAMVALVRWLWRVAKLLVVSCFYVSDSQAAPNQLVFIPKKTWQSETDRAFNSFSNLQPLTNARALAMEKERKHAVLRWMPKIEGLRPILFIRGDKNSRDTKEAKDLVLSLLKKTMPLNLISYMNDAWGGLIKLQNKGKKIYFIACDIHDAFGSVNQDKLIEILEGEIIKNYGSFGIHKFSREICNIKRAVKCQTVRKMKKSYLLSNGLAQGAPLSGPLCNLYLSHIDRTCLASFTSDPEDKLIRAVDDYLYVTPDKDKAQRFLDTMSAGFVDYGVKIKHQKTQTNLKSDSEILYYGYLINTATLEVFCRYNQGINVTSRNSMVFRVDPILAIDDKLVHMPLVKLNRLTLDRRYMTVEGVAHNVVHTACMLACRLMGILALTRACDVPDTDRLANVVARSAQAVAGRAAVVWGALIRDANTYESARGNSFLRVTKEDIQWIALRAFSMVLSRALYMRKNFPHDLVVSVCELETVMKAKVQPSVIGMTYSVVNNIPMQFYNLAD